jgi:hypothetical protein
MLSKLIPYKLAYKTPYVARAGQMLCLGGTIEKGIYYVDGLCAIQILLGRISDTPLAGYYKPGGLIPKGGFICHY